MSSFNPNKDVPTEFYSAKTFFTLSGAAASVWIFCLVIGSICPSDSISPLLYRIIAISLSEIIAFFMVFRAKRKKLEHWFLAIFNGLLIFINASGWNVITTNNFFSDKNKAKSPNTFILTNSNYVYADFLFFKNQIYWWQDNRVFLENKKLKEENKVLTEKASLLDKKIAEINERTSNESTANINNLNDSLRNEINKKENLIHELKNEVLLLKNTSTKNNRDIGKAVITDTLSSEERIKLLRSISALRQNYETKLKICDSEKKELQSKLNIMRHSLDKYGGVNNP